MAAVPTFPVEDQTDEDFFDKLVEDEGEASGSTRPFEEHLESDDVRAFEDLGVGEVRTSEDALDGVDSLEGAHSDECSKDDENCLKDDVDFCPVDPNCDNKGPTEAANMRQLEDNRSESIDDSGNHVDGVDSMVIANEKSESTDDSGNYANSVQDSKSSNNEGSVGGIKEVQWSAFGSDINDSGDGSYSDFFSGVEGNIEDSFGAVAENSVVGSGSHTDILPNTAEDPTLSSFVQNNQNLGNVVYTETSSYTMHEVNQNGSTYAENLSGVQDVNSVQYWESLYPGWRYDANTGQWHQVDSSGSVGNSQESYNAVSQSAGDTYFAEQQSDVSYLQHTAQTSTGNVIQGSTGENAISQSIGDSNFAEQQSGVSYLQHTAQTSTGNVIQGSTGDNAISQSVGDANFAEQQSDVSYLQHTAQTSTGNAIQGSAGDSVSCWNAASGEAQDYPSNMVFDPQYPGWYYDTIDQEWKSLESYTSSLNQVQNCEQSQLSQSINAEMVHNQASHVNHVQHGYDNSNLYQQQAANWGAFSAQTIPVNNHVQSGNTDSAERTGFSAPGAVAFEASHLAYGSNGNYAMQGFVPDQSGLFEGSAESREPLMTPTAATFPDHTGRSLGGTNGTNGFQGFAPAQHVALNHNNHDKELNHHQQFSPAPFNGSDFSNFSKQQPERDSQYPFAPTGGRSPDGRPPHALVAFGFGGKLIVMKDQLSAATSSFGVQGSAGGVVNVLNLVEVAMPKSDGTGVGFTVSDYFHTLCYQSYPGPLVSGNAGTKELNKWIDEKVANGGMQETDAAKAEVTRMLFSLLKIACQYYGKLRTPFGTGNVLKENDCPESALAKLFASTKGNNTQLAQYGAQANCLKSLPSAEQVQATALEVEKLLVTGRRMEALQCAQEGQLWGPAIVISALLGDTFYGETVKQMAINQLVAGCPLRTLSLLIAGQPAEVFSRSTTNYNQSNPFNVSQPVQVGSNCMLDKWEENLAIITANRTNGDELVITHLGDCLLKERGEVTAAHICYLVAEANIEPYSDSARLCLIGADHWKNPRTYATPEAIQRTELYEYAKVLGNSQLTLLSFQPYKLVYANMLAEVGKLSDALKYCQAISKSLRTGRALEVDTWRNLVSSLEERIKTHQQGGYAANLAPAKLVAKMLNFFDSTANRVVGLPPPARAASPSNDQHYGNDSRGNRVSASQSTMAMSSLTSSASVEPVNEWSGNINRKLHSRSNSEPVIGRTPGKVPSDDSTSSGSQESTTSSAAPSRFGRFGSQLLQKTVGLVLRTNSKQQAKLGETNKFYYDEKLKRWVEEGAEAPAEEPALPPPPTTSSFMNGMPDQHMKVGSLSSTPYANNEQPQFKSPDPTDRGSMMPPVSSDKSSVMPPISPATNQFSSRGRMGVRARYVDTFNKGGGAPANSFLSPPVPAAKPPALGNAKFFVPAPAPAGEETSQATENKSETYTSDTAPMLPDHTNTLSPPPSESHMPPPTASLQRYPSLDNMGMAPNTNTNTNTSPFQPSRRTASWGGGNSGGFMPHPNMTDSQPHGEAFNFPPQAFMPNEQLPGNAAEVLHEVEL